MIIWGAWKDAVVPLQVQDLRREWQLANPTWSSRIVQDTFINNMPVAPDTKHVFLNAPIGVMRGDLMRYLVVYYYGGMWLDLDVKHVKPIAKWMSAKKELVIGIERATSAWTERQRGHMCQWFFAARPRHGVLKTAIELSTSRMLDFLRMDLSMRKAKLRDANEVHYLTGPALFTDSVCKYYNISPCVDMNNVKRRLPQSVQVLDEADARTGMINHLFASNAWSGYNSWTREKQSFADG